MSKPWTKEELDELLKTPCPHRGHWRNGSACRADSDGDCTWVNCPQLTDRRQSHCPLDLPPFASEDDDDR